LTRSGDGSRRVGGTTASEISDRRERPDRRFGRLRGKAVAEPGGPETEPGRESFFETERRMNANQIRSESLGREPHRRIQFRVGRHV
jgi:hypothetical protein